MEEIIPGWNEGQASLMEEMAPILDDYLLAKLKLQQMEAKKVINVKVRLELQRAMIDATLQLVNLLYPSNDDICSN